ncbi:hypothetical protein A2331_03410 [Candidatus Falkowbacteria bacterium RIFOXYB2_FULL_34_18]|uniref:Helix-turn-helix type 11 domain-containing protein n=1 Tax=Candidatus Falkowbacteria bacterium RIFOXYD2_FULL_34_120 TaxID=1798007 RepID=A0A1F5TNH6_9BACT|nr:MAG: hypothetical protein A2331_03410 [Candidatus Falkowbacteria bacterium RIFOXYB2_FULL_34_18]OGF28932.1 MAG: hypothetical protein A2500_01650 [Candidatus Falkowbacteria bacterium RIFOXYC12_FULL_34_55]OGF35869.1 MAG: hypothetical protein A2466_03730 [Candidatus Falkowbacteria bacterium RIFOXYC2_FULL_34_220]OGF38476.1 MAG: hypothetical protein A2515_07100 [Candidatus Falkowbacteria bacterium RIFOXYD12_FULL_34_57]OGF40542.1 MAG: hypothetical protein A2531_04515 [Candidatus Falkowbacteria bact
MKTSEKIIKYIKAKGQATGSELADYLDISDRGVRKQLAVLLEKGILKKIGKPPKVFYLIKNKQEKSIEIEIDDKLKEKIDENYLAITPGGEKKEGIEGFKYWCKKNNLPIEKTAKEYIKTMAKYEIYKKDGIVNGMEKIKNTFKEVFLDELFYLDFYSIERFGKTKLGQLLLYAKQSQNKMLMKELIREIKPKVDQLIKKYKIDGIGYIPPTVKRETQLMKVLERGLHENLRSIVITKVKTAVAVPQKTLNKLNDRIENARITIMVEERNKFKNILLVDDAVGSGATMNEVAQKIREKNICRGKIIGLAITGSFKGFDIISEV